MRALRTFCHAILGFGLGVLAVVMVILAFGFFIGLPIYSGITYARTGQTSHLVWTLLPLMILCAVTLVAIKKRWIAFKAPKV